MVAQGSVPGLNGKRPTEKGNRTRERIIVAATELFAERGYHATGLSDIGERADIQRGALYYHIRAKEELLFEILQRVINEILEALQAVAAEPIGSREKVRRLILCQSKILLDNRQAMLIYTRDQSALTNDRQQRFRRLQADVEEVWNRVLMDGQRDGELREFDAAIVKCMIGLVNSPVPWFTPGGRLSSDDVGLMLADLLLEGMSVSQASAKS